MLHINAFFHCRYSDTLIIASGSIVIVLLFDIVDTGIIDRLMVLAFNYL